MTFDGIPSDKFFCRCNNRPIGTTGKPYSLDDPELSRLKAVLPKGFEYNVCSFKEEENGFIATVRLPIRTKEDALHWKITFQETSNTTMRVSRTYAKSGVKNIYRVDFRCHHNTRQNNIKAKVSSKNTNCPASMIVVVKRNDRKYSRSKDIHLYDFPMIVKMKFLHNHSIHSADILRFRDVSGEVMEKFRKLFEVGHSPSSALQWHKRDIGMAYKDEELIKIMADRAQVPDQAWCYRFYYTLYGKQPRKKKEDVPKNSSCSASLRSDSSEEVELDDASSLYSVEVETAGQTASMLLGCENPGFSEESISNIEKELLSFTSLQSYSCEEVEHDGASSMLEGVSLDIGKVETAGQAASVSLGHENYGFSEEISKAKNELLSFVKSVTECLERDPETFIPAVNEFVNNFEKLSTNSAKVSALMTFGKYPGVSDISQNKHKRKRLSGCKNIGVKPTAVSKRKNL